MTLRRIAVLFLQLHILQQFMEILQPSKQEEQHILQDRGADALEIFISSSVLPLPVSTPPPPPPTLDGDRSAQLFPSIGVDRVLRVPCQL